MLRMGSRMANYSFFFTCSGDDYKKSTKIKPIYRHLFGSIYNFVCKTIGNLEHIIKQSTDPHIF